MTYKRHITGQQAEKQAQRYLETKGMTLIQANYQCYQGEIDLIMLDGNHIVFVEVRSRARIEYGNALESITPSKIKKIIRAATHFLQKKNWLYSVPSRFDVIAIHPTNGELQLEWIKNAFLAEN